MSNKEIHKICKEYGIENYTIEDGLVNVNGNVYLGNKGLEKLPLRFGIVSGSFDCHYNNLTSLEGGPKEVGYYFDCSHNKLDNLRGAPIKVGDSFYCYNNLKELSYERYLNKMNRLKKLKELDVG